MKLSTKAEIETQLRKLGILKTATITVGGVTGEYKHVTKAQYLEALKAIVNPTEHVLEMIEWLQSEIVREQVEESE